MKVRLSLFGPLKNPFGKTELTIEIAEGTTLKKFIMQEMGYKEHELDYLITAIGEDNVDVNTVVKEGDSVKIYLPVGGG